MNNPIPLIDNQYFEGAQIHGKVTSQIIDQITTVISNNFVNYGILTATPYTAATVTIPATAIIAGGISSTSSTAFTATLDTAANISTLTNVGQGDTFEFLVDNTGGANTITVAVNTGITVPTTVVITGGATLTVASGNIGVFKLVFSSSTAAILFRIG
jgi:hypothetical protein